MKVSKSISHIICAALIALLIFACDGKKKDVVAKPAALGESGRVLTTNPYGLKIFFDGLIAFVEDSQGGDKRLWALLVDARYNLDSVVWNQSTNTLDFLNPDELPPCAFAEAVAEGTGAKTYIENHFISHEARVRFHNAIVRNENKQVLSNELDIPLIDIVISTGSGGNFTVLDFDKISNIDEVSATPGRGQATSFDEINSNYLKEYWGDVEKKYLAARILIASNNLGGNATITANAIGCRPRYMSYGFEEASLRDCKESTPPARLAEEVLFFQEIVNRKTILSWGDGKEVSVEPAGGAKEVMIEILNIAKHAYSEPVGVNFEPEPDRRGCITSGMHLDAYRWFYRFSKTQPTSCQEHYFPCLSSLSPHGGRKCPQMLFVK